MSQTPANLLAWIHKSDNLQFSLERALSYARERSHAEVTLEHLLVTLTDDPIAAAFLEACGINVMLIRSDALNYIDKQLSPVPDVPPPGPEASDGLRKVMTHAAAAAEQSGRPIIDGAIVLAALIGDGESHAARILKAHGLTFEVAIDRLRLNPDQAAGDRIASPPPESSAPQNPSPPKDRPAAGEISPPPSVPKDAEDFSAPGASHSPGAFQSTASGPGDDRSETRPSAEQDAGKTARRTAPTIEEIQSTVSNLIAENRKTAEAAESETMNTQSGASESPSRETEAGKRHGPNHFVPLPSHGTGPESAPPGNDDRGQPNSLSNQHQTEPGKSGPPRRPGVSQWPFAWQETPPGSVHSEMLPRPTIPGPDPAFEPRAPSPTARFETAPAQDNWQGGRHNVRPPAKTTTPGRFPSPPQTAEKSAWTPLLPAEERKSEHDPSKTAHSRAAAERSRLKETIPRSMRVLAPRTVEVAVGRINIAEISDSEEDSWRMERRQAFVTEAMTVQLKAPDGGFLIENKTPETQWIDHRLGLIPEDLASWHWTVTPNRPGRFRLQIIVSARTINEHGAIAESSVPEHIVNVRVRSNYFRALGRFAGLVVAALLGGVLVHYGETIWPLGRKLYEIIQ